MEENSNIQETMEEINEQIEQDKKENPRKITFFEILVLLLLIVSVGVYLSPNFTLNAEMRKNSKMQTNAAIFTSKVLSEYSLNKKAKASLVSEKIAEELNAVTKNPYSKKEPAYSLGKQCPGCVVITTDDKINCVTVAAYGKDGVLLTRTLIQPPSFVTYTRDLELDAANKKAKK